MTTNRRPAGQGRRLAVLAALVILAGCVLPWWRLGGGDGIPPISGNAFEAIGIVVFLVAVTTLAIVTLPYAAKDQPVLLDRWPVFSILAIAGWIALGLRILDLASSGALAFREPEQVITNGPGLWLVALGLIGLSRAAFEVAHEAPRR